MDQTIRYTGRILTYLPSLLHKSIKQIIEELNDHGISCTRPTYREWANEDIKMSNLLSLCNLYHIPIYYFFEIQTFPKTDSDYLLVQGNWVDIDIKYDVIARKISEVYGSRINAVSSHAISESRYGAMKRNDHAALQNLMASYLVALINKYQIPIVNVLRDLNVPFVQSNNQYGSVCAIQGYEETFRLSEDTNNVIDDEAYQDKLIISRLRQLLIIERREKQALVNTVNSFVDKNKTDRMKAK